MTSSLVGTVLDGKFQIEKALASGASGDVYEAIHLGLGSRVAVKVLRPGLPQTAHVRRKRFVREARVAARIQSAITSCASSTSSRRTQGGSLSTS